MSNEAFPYMTARFIDIAGVRVWAQRIHGGTGLGTLYPKDIGLIYLPLDLAKPGIQVEVEVMGELVKVEVVPTPMVDPEGERIRS